MSMFLLLPSSLKEKTMAEIVKIFVFVCVLKRIFENELFKQDWRGSSKVQVFQYIFMKWLLCFLIGLIVSLIGFCNNLAVENLAGTKFVVTSNMMLESRSIFFFSFDSVLFGLMETAQNFPEKKN